MKIAIVALTDFDVVTSTVRRVQMIGKSLTTLGHEVHIIIPQRFSQSPLMQEIDGLTIHWGATTSQEQWRTVGARLKARWATLRLVNELAAAGMDWLILYNLGLEGLALLTAAHRHGTRVAAEYCDVREGPKHPQIEDRVRTAWHGLADLLVPRRTDLNIGISRFLVQWLRTKAPRTPVLLVPPIVDTDLFQVQADKAESFRKKWQIGDEAVIAYLGSYWKIEGVATLLQATRGLATAGESFRLVLSGSEVVGRDCDDVPGIVRMLNLDRFVIQTGWLTTDEVIAAMSAADILVVPKTDDIANQAGVATKMVEYLAMARAVVATNVGDVPLHLHDGTDALLCSANNPAELAGKLQHLLHAPRERSRLGNNARQTALNCFDYRSVGRHIDASMR
jgi:glycosyltransferase involved in cell wall biosynthesis